MIDGVQGTDRGGHYPRGYREVTGGGFDPAVSQQHLDDADVGTVFQQMGSEGMAQGVDRDALGNAGAQGGLAASQL